MGVLADTHCPEFMDELPAAVFEAFTGVDLIIHAGDITGEETLRALSRIAPVKAVRGDHDKLLRDLPKSIEFDVEGHRVAVIHGNRNRLIEEPVTFIGTITLGHLWFAPRLRDWLARRFPAADVIIYGHTHHAVSVRSGDRFFFNPGAVYQVTEAAAQRRLARRPNWFEWTWLQVARHRRTALRHSVGILEIDHRTVRGHIIRI